MRYTENEVMQFVQEEDVKFIRLAFCDVFGIQKNIAILPTELERAFRQGIGIDASAIDGFGGEVKSDIFLHPDPGTLASLPWRSENGRVVRMFCSVTHPDGSLLQSDLRSLLIRAIDEAAEQGIRFDIGTEMEFYLFKTDENGEPTGTPYDKAGYMDIAPEDKGENIRREICLTLSQMGILPESSNHEEGPGQNRIEFRYSDPLNSTDNALTFRSVVKAIAGRNGLFADFSPKPIPDQPGNGLHVNISVNHTGGEKLLPSAIAGVLRRIREITLFLNPLKDSYARLGNHKAPGFVSWSGENRSQLIRVPADPGGVRRMELRSPDPAANPYLAAALLIYAMLEGIGQQLTLPECADINLFTAAEEVRSRFERLPATLEEAKKAAAESDFVRRHVPAAVLAAYLEK